MPFPVLTFRTQLDFANIFTQIIVTFKVLIAKKSYQIRFLSINRQLIKIISGPVDILYF